MKILQIAYYFPPMGGAGVQRALKFAKYLPEFGVQPVVLAAEDRGYISDPSLAQEIPASVAVHRIPHQPLARQVLALLRRGKSPSGTATQATSSTASTRSRWLRDAALRSYAALQFPDDKARWARRAEVEARRILRDEKIDLVLTSSPPVSSHRLGARLAGEFKLPWVADFRDLWTDNPGYAAPAWRRAIDRRCEAEWLAQASGVIAVTPSWQALLTSRLKGRCPVTFIPNGYDEEDFAGLSSSTRDDRVFRLVHTGTFYGPRDPSTLLEGVAAYLRHPTSERSLRVRLIGEMGSRFAQRLAQFEREHPGVVELRPYVPHRQALAELAAADGLLLVVGGGNSAAASGWLPGKIFEYLRADKPVLILGREDGDAVRIMQRHARSFVADETSPEKIAVALGALVAASGGSAAGAPLDCAGVAGFERRELSRQLAEFLARCAGGASG